MPEPTLFERLERIEVCLGFRAYPPPPPPEPPLNMCGSDEGQAAQATRRALIECREAVSAIMADLIPLPQMAGLVHALGLIAPPGPLPELMPEPAAPTPSVVETGRIATRDAKCVHCGEISEIGRPTRHLAECKVIVSGFSDVPSKPKEPWRGPPSPLGLVDTDKTALANQQCSDCSAISHVGRPIRHFQDCPALVS